MNIVQNNTTIVLEVAGSKAAAFITIDVLIVFVITNSNCVAFRLNSLITTIKLVLFELKCKSWHRVLVIVGSYGI
ncbi:hypothetical protein EXS66_01490 [Candidatus Saccharibacteria bacterium]|nr:hypothetical protein [Candidatus Saccharibacteria bacterium]